MIKQIIISGIALACCESPDMPAISPVRPAQVIYVGESHIGQFDARSGDTIIVTLNSGGDPLARCDDMGGELIYNPFTVIFTCEGVDF